MKKETAKKHAIIIRDTFADQYTDEETYSEEMIANYTEKEAFEFVKSHIENMIAINGTDELWSAELKAAKDLNININY